MADPRDRERDGDKRELVLAPNEFAHIQDTSKGEIDTYVGPFKVPPSGDNVPMIFNDKTKRFQPVTMEDSKQSFITAPAGWYTVLLNPSNRHPKPGKNSSPDDIVVGKKIVVPGPCTFPLWPGQMAEVIPGHRLRSNEYLIIEVYDDEAARIGWKSATVKTASQTKEDETDPVKTGGDGEKEKEAAGTKDEKTVSGLLSSVPADLANGKRYIIKGTEYAFYIPPSGVKVLKGKNGYIQPAVTLEKLEYAILLDESGEKEYAYGPRVVFPQPTQQFITVNGLNKYRAIELDARKGIYIKVIESYKDSDDVSHNEGEELFISGDGIIYFPRKEHSIIKYGEQEMHYATAIPKGEGRYVLDRVGGEVKIAVGPKMFLPDPRNAVITRRILTQREVRLFYPGNTEALEVNRVLAEKNRDFSPESLAAFMERSGDITYGAEMLRGIGDSPMAKRSLAEERIGGSSFERKTGYTQPRTVVLDTKYQGVPPINVWTGYAVKVVNKTGSGKVVVGPNAILLEYDETLEPMQLSTGKPKSDDKLLETAYLKVHGNKVSDKIEAITADLVKVTTTLSYRVNFEGDDPIKWFSVENYVKFLCDHINSVVKSAVKKCRIADLHANFTEIIRDTILGKKPESGDRPGMLFEENRMRIYDVEVFDLAIGDQEVQALLINAQQTSIRTALKISNREQEVAAITVMESLTLEELKVKRITEEAKHEAELARIEESGFQEEARQDVFREAEEKSLEHKNEIARTTFEHDASITHDRVLNTEKLELEKIREEQIRTEVKKAIEEVNQQIQVAKWKATEEHERTLIELANNANGNRAAQAEIIAKAFSPQLIEAINSLRDANLLRDLASKFGDLSVLEGKGIMATASRFLDVIPQGLIPVLSSFLPKGTEAGNKATRISEEG